MIERTEYLEKLKRFKDKDLIKVVTGIRRCGKSTLFELFIKYLKEIGIKDSQIIKINLEDAEYDFKDYKELYNYINNKLDSKTKYYIFLDEVQNVPMFQKAVDSLYIKKNVDVYITGSNAYLLSGELATLLSGRYIEIKMLPLSFKEYLSAFDNKEKSNYEDQFEDLSLGSHHAVSSTSCMRWRRANANPNPNSKARPHSRGASEATQRGYYQRNGTRCSKLYPFWYRKSKGWG